MAIVKNPLSSEDARNKFGPVIVFSGWRSIKVVRSNVFPTNPRTSEQTNIRAILATLSAEWNALTWGNATSWNDYAGAHPRRNAFGEFKGSGINAYVELNFNRAYQSVASSATPPTAAFKGNVTGLTDAGTGGSGEVEITWTDVPTGAAGDTIRVDISRQMRSNHEVLGDSDFRIFDYIADGVETATIPGLVPSGYYTVRVRFVQVDGRAGVIQSEVCVAHA